MRTLFKIAVVVLISIPSLTGQVVPRPSPPRQSTGEDPGTYLVTFRPGVQASQRAAVVQASGAQVRTAYRSLNAAAVTVPDAAALARLRNDPRVLYVFANRKMTLSAPQGRGGNGGGSGKPSAPENLGATAISSSQINLAWTDASNNETGFAIERCVGSGCSNFSELLSVGPNVTTHGDTGLSAQTRYRYRVRAVNSSGNSKYSNIAEATTSAPPPSPPLAPTNLTTAAVSYSEIGLNWSDNSGNETGFRLERCAGSGCSNFSEIHSTVANVSIYSNTGLAAQTVYRYRVLAFNAVGSSSYSNIAETTTPDSPPSAPSNLSALAVSHSEIGLTWSDNSGNETGFRLERCADSGCFNFAEIHSTVANVTSYSNTGLAAQTVYRYRVLAFNAVGSSTYSNIAETTTPAAPPPPPTPPAAPANLIAAAVSYSEIGLNWSDNSNDETGFRVERCAGSGCANFAEILSTAADVTSYSNTGLAAQTLYRYRVLAFNAVGSSTYSNIAETTTPDSPPAAPASLTALAVSHSEIGLNWSDNSSNETGFRLERCAGPGCANFAEIHSTVANVISYSNTGLSAQTLYRYRVQAFNAVGSSTYSNIAETTTPTAPPPPPSTPAAPTNLTSTAFSHNQVDLFWSDNSANEDGFRIERCTGTVATCTNANFSQIGQVGPDIDSVSNLGVLGQTTYTYRVLAFNAAGTSAYSNSSQVTTPASPSGAQVVPAGVQRIGAAPGTLNWTGAGVGVAVVDTGLDFAHLDLGLAPEVVGVNAFNAFGGSCQDIHGHGTHVAGIVGARNNQIDVVGVAPNVTIYCVSVFEPDPANPGNVLATDASLLAGLDWIAANANILSPRIRVINMSLGRDKTFEDDNPNHPLRLAVKALHDSGITVVVAAGNDPERQVIQQVPAGYPDVIAVASTTAQDGVNGYDPDFPACPGLQSIKADTASYFTTDGAFVAGTGVTVSAPGDQQEDLFMFFGTCFLEPIGILSLAAGGGTIEQSGTSMASPHVAGVVALMWEKELASGSSLAPEVARSRIRNNVSRPGTAPLDSPLSEYTFDNEREGVIWAPAALGDAPAPPRDTPPTVSILSPTTGTNFSSGASITFQGSVTDAEDGNIASALAWTSNRDGQIGTGASFTRTLSNGLHSITASIVDSGGNPANAGITISVGSSTPTTVRVFSVTYAMQGTTLNYTLKLVDEFNQPVPGATVTASLYEFIFTGNLWFTTGVTDSQGNVRFQLLNADIGCYATGAENVVAPGLTWVPGVPSNSFCRL